MTKCWFLNFLRKIDVFWLLDHWCSSKTRRATIDWNYAKICIFWWKIEYFGSKNHIRPDDQISKWRISANFGPLPTIVGAKDICLMKKAFGNIWSTFRQHLLPKWCSKSLVRQKMCKNAFLYRSLRQKLTNICCLTNFL